MDAVAVAKKQNRKGTLFALCVCVVVYQMAKAVRLLKLEKVLSNLEEKFMIRANVLKVHLSSRALMMWQTRRHLHASGWLAGWLPFYVHRSSDDAAIIFVLHAVCIE